MDAKECCFMSNFFVESRGGCIRNRPLSFHPYFILASIPFHNIKYINLALVLSHETIGLRVV